MYETLSFEELMARYYSCDELAFSALYHRTFPLVCGFFRARGVSRQDAEDFAQEVFLKVTRTKHTQKGRYDPSRCPFLALLFTICRHLLCDIFRGKGKEPPVQEAAPEVQEAASVVEDEPIEPFTAEELPGFELFLTHFRECRSRLPPGLQEVFDFETILEDTHLNKVWVAAFLGIPYMTARGRVYRARQQLQACLRERGYRVVARGTPLPAGACIVARFPQGDMLIYDPKSQES